MFVHRKQIDFLRVACIMIANVIVIIVIVMFVDCGRTKISVQREMYAE